MRHNQYVKDDATPKNRTVYFPGIHPGVGTGASIRERYGLFGSTVCYDLVHVQLNNTDAFSSIRGVYGGVGLTLFISLIYLMRKDIRAGLLFLRLLWGFYALSRAITILAEGALGAFGRQWFLIESVLFGIAVILSLLYDRLATRAARPLQGR